jgi:hypothetical protein
MIIARPSEAMLAYQNASEYYEKREISMAGLRYDLVVKTLEKIRNISKSGCRNLTIEITPQSAHVRNGQTIVKPSDSTIILIDSFTQSEVLKMASYLSRKLVEPENGFTVDIHNEESYGISIVIDWSLCGHK